MNIKGFGVNTFEANGSFQRVEEQLDYLKEAGFEYLEVSPDMVDTIGGGKIIPKRMNKLLKLLDRYGFKHTTHIQKGVDLRDKEDSDFQLELFKAGIEFAGIIGSELLVCHFEKGSDDPVKESLFRETMLQGLDYARRQNVKIGIENVEVDTLSKVVDFVKEVNEPDLFLVLDVGHAFLSERYFGENFLESLKNAASLVGHIHISDNFGRFEKMRLENFDLYRVSNYINRHNLGRGDIHLPPGWGVIPYEEVLKVFESYQGIVILEYWHDRFLDFNPEILQETKSLFSKYLPK